MRDVTALYNKCEDMTVHYKRGVKQCLYLYLFISLIQGYLTKYIN